MTRPISFFIGATNSFNVRHLVANLDWMLADEDPLHLITTNSEIFDDITDSFRLFGDEYNSSLKGEVTALRNYLDNNDPAVLVQLTRPPVHGTICGLTTLRRDVPFVYRYSGDRFGEWRVAQGKERITGFALGNVLGRLPLILADRYVTLGASGTKRLIDRGVTREEVTILPPSVDVSRFECATDSPVDLPDGHSMVLFVGRLSRLKGLETLEGTLPRILDRRDDLEFVFVGDTENNLALPVRHRSHVSTHGPVTPEEMPAYYQQADLLLHPSLTEGIPRVILEALASGTPVLARDIGDVSSVTANTFVSDDEMIDMLLEFESLAVDDVTPFSRERLGPRYRDFYGSFRK